MKRGLRWTIAGLTFDRLMFVTVLTIGTFRYLPKVQIERIRFLFFFQHGNRIRRMKVLSAKNLSVFWADVIMLL